MINRSLSTSIETLFIPTDPEYFVLRSRIIRELVWFGGDISTMVPREIMDKVVERFGTRE